MSVGQIIASTFGMVKERFGPLLALWAIYFAIIIALSFVAVAGMGVATIAGAAAAGDANALAAGGGMLLGMILFYVGYLLVLSAQYASLVVMASPNSQSSVSEALGAGWRAAPALLLLMVVLILCYLVALIPLGALGAVFALFGRAGSVVALVVMALAAAWVFSRLAPLYGVIAVDKVRNPFKAIGRSWAMTRGHALTIFLATLVLTLVLLLVACAALLPSIGLLRSMFDPATAAAGPAFGGMALFLLGFLVISVVFNLCQCAFFAVVHAKLSNAGGEGLVEAFA